MLVLHRSESSPWRTGSTTSCVRGQERGLLRPTKNNSIQFYLVSLYKDRAQQIPCISELRALVTWIETSGRRRNRCRRLEASGRAKLMEGGHLPWPVRWEQSAAESPEVSIVSMQKVMGSTWHPGRGSWLCPAVCDIIHTSWICCVFSCYSKEAEKAKECDQKWSAVEATMGGWREIHISMLRTQAATQLN